MASFDNALAALGKTKAVYEGDPPTTQAEYEANVTFLDDEVAPTWDEIQTQISIEDVRIARAPLYPSLQEQLDMQYWDSVNGTTTWADAIAAVKAANPKPE